MLQFIIISFFEKKIKVFVLFEQNLYIFVKKLNDAVRLGGIFEFQLVY